MFTEEALSGFNITMLCICAVGIVIAAWIFAGTFRRNKSTDQG